MTDKIFELNDFGVCINPNVIIFENEKFNAEIKTAFIDNGWYFGTSSETKNSGHAFCIPPAHHRPDPDPHAIPAGITQLVNFGFNVEVDNEQLTFEDIACLN